MTKLLLYMQYKMAAPIYVNRTMYKSSTFVSRKLDRTIMLYLPPRNVKQQASLHFYSSKCVNSKIRQVTTKRKEGQILCPSSSSSILSSLALSRPYTLSPETSTHSLNAKAQERLGHLMQLYEDFVGLTEVKEAQNKVVTAEQKFLQVQEDRRSMQAELLAVQADVRAVSGELEKTSRTDSRYIDLVKREHEALLVEKDMSTKIKALDKAERDFFALLSAALRESHEKERSRAERTKYWSVIGSIIGAIIGIIGSTVNNMRRMKELRSIVSESGENTAEYKNMVIKILQSANDQNLKLEEFFNSLNVQQVQGLDGPIGTNPLMLSTTATLINKKDLMESTEAITRKLEKQSNHLSSQLQEITKIIGVSHAQGDIGHVVYTGPEVETLMAKTEENLQNNMTKNAIISVLASSALALGVGLICFIFRGS